MRPGSEHVLGGVLLSLVCTSGAAAATLNVCPSGCTYTTIQAAVNHAVAGDTVSIGPGTYFENVKIPGSAALTLLGAGERRTIIDGNLQGPVFVIGNAQSPNGGAAITFSDVTISRGAGANGGGIVILNESPVVIQHSILLSNRSTGSGGAIQTSSSPSITITDCNFINNQAVFSGGALELDAEVLTLTVSDSVFSRNLAGGFGGAIETSAHVTTGTFTNSSFVLNHAKIGGALWLGNLYGAQLNLTDVTVNGNSASQDAGGIFFAGKAVLTRSFVTHNVAGGNGGGMTGADLFRSASQLSLVDSEVSWNKATGQGGGLFEDFILTESGSTVAHNTPNDCVESSTGAPCT